MPHLEVWEKVYMSDPEFLMSTHGKVGCVICHGGDSGSDDKYTAHAELIADPSEVDCSTCHADIYASVNSSLHQTLSAFIYNLEQRGGDFSENSALSEAFDKHCTKCHATCGQCHVSIPTELGGGLVENHEFMATPTLQYNCYACHGARPGDEYYGANVGIPADVHYAEDMTCTDCHSVELHGSGELEDTRYHNDATASCDDCHLDIWENTEDNPQHEQHLSDLACQVCHSVSYKNCYSCHVGTDDLGLPYYQVEPSEMHFEIGLNPIRSADNPYEYVVLRHPPVSIDTFVYYGENLLPDFNNLPTWKYATPHNTQLETPQNQSCNACHGVEDYFLLEDDVAPEEIEANQGVIVTEIPEPVEEDIQAHQNKEED